MNVEAGSPIAVSVDPSNPGQFFACCGLLELAERFWGGSEGWFESHSFLLWPLSGRSTEHRGLSSLISRLLEAEIRPTRPEDLASPLEISSPFHLRLDWWHDHLAGGERYKLWAGSMSVARITSSLQATLADARLKTEDLFGVGMVVPNPENPKKKTEPFQFDTRRGASALPLDVGFSPNPLNLSTISHPAVELLCLIGLQRFRPAQTTVAANVFDYWTWTDPTDSRLAAGKACGILADPHAQGYRFRTRFRTEYHKAFCPAQPLKRRHS
jgi:CRISPR-associated protein Csb3